MYTAHRTAQQAELPTEADSEDDDDGDGDGDSGGGGGGGGDDDGGGGGDGDNGNSGDSGGGDGDDGDKHAAAAINKTEEAAAPSVEDDAHTAAAPPTEAAMERGEGAAGPSVEADEGGGDATLPALVDRHAPTTAIASTQPVQEDVLIFFISASPTACLLRGYSMGVPVLKMTTSEWSF